MTRLQKKCFVFSLGLHGLLVVIVCVSAAFRGKPEEPDSQVLSIIPATLLDRAGAGGGTPVANVAPPQPLPPQPQAAPRVEAPPTPKVQPRETQPAPAPVVKHTEPPVPERQPVETTPEPAVSLEPRPARHHEVHPSYVPATSITKTKKTTETAQASQIAAAAAERKRIKRVEESLAQLASGVQSSAAEKTVVDVPGVGGGGEAFAGYNEAVKSYYYHAWITQDSVPDRVSEPEARVEVARDGSIISAELVTPSGEAALDKSVERALRAVKKLPPFPTGARDERRVFRIRFSLEAKEASG